MEVVLVPSLDHSIYINVDAVNGSNGIFLRN